MRELSQGLKNVMATGVRQHTYAVHLWDVVTAGAPSAGTIIAGNASSAYQLDVTEFVHGGISIQEPGDRRASRLTMTLSDIYGSFDPASGQYAAWIKPNQLVRVLEGDSSVDTDEHVYTFTGHVRGQVGFSINRSSLRKESSVVAYGRRATPRWSRMPVTTRTYGRAVDYGAIVTDIAATHMGLSPTEIATPGTLGHVTQFAANNIVNMSPLEALDAILQTVGKYADFNGDGKLIATSYDLRSGPVKSYTDQSLVVEISVPNADVELYNQVRVVGLDKNLTEITQPDQALARATIPVGFWRPAHKVLLQWSNDRSLRAQDTYMNILVSVNDNIFFNFGSESYIEADEFSGTITVEITTYILTLLVLITVTLIASYFVGDEVTVPGGLTIPIGKLLTAAAMQEILITLATQSSGQYEIRGVPILPVYKEIAVTLSTEGTPDYLVNQIEIRNDWINTHDHLLDVATIQLWYESAQGLPREVEVINDLELEIGDIIEIPTGGELPLRMWVDSINKTLSRDNVPVMRLTGYLIPVQTT